MATDARTSLQAWRTIPQTREAAAGVGSFTSTRVERITMLVIGVGSLALGAQAFGESMSSTAERPGWNLILQLLLFVPLAAMVVATFVGRWVRPTAAIFAIVYPVSLVLWPFVTENAGNGEAASEKEPWVFFLISVASLVTVLVFSRLWQVVWAIGMPILYGFARLAQLQYDSVLWVPTILDVSFALILNGTLLTLARMFRRVAVNVDQTRERAVETYARAAASDAVEKERISVAALMHDSVLAALISAERARSPRERSLAVSMAREALTRLANTERDAGMGSDDPCSMTELSERIRTVVRDAARNAPVDVHLADANATVPGRVARAVVLAVAQATANAVQHAGGRGLAVHVDSEVAPVRLSVQVADEGPGFDPEAVPADRLGISASIIARIAAVGGFADIASGPDGTMVDIRWREELA